MLLKPAIYNNSTGVNYENMVFRAYNPALLVFYNRHGGTSHGQGAGNG